MTRKILFFTSLTISSAIVCYDISCRKSSPSETSRTITNTIGIKLSYIPAGKFLMGSPPDEKGRQPDESHHHVQITKGFFMATTEITQAQWSLIMEFNRSNFKGDNLPMEKISFNDVGEFCRRLSKKEKRTYRLPTEAEWEYACRAGSSGPFAGSGNIEDMAWYIDNSEEKTQPVATKKPNAWGLYDMHGNVSEWCSDYYAHDYSTEMATDPRGPLEGKYRVVRGGSWSYSERGCRSAARSSAPPSYQLKQTGFRVVMEDTK